MSAVVFLLVCFLLCSVSAEPQIHQITVEPGQTVILPCRAPYNAIIAAVKWTRSDLDRHVYLKEGRRLNTADQDPSYKNRVQLMDNQMRRGGGRVIVKDTELSLILKNVNSKDEGAYVCRCKEEEGDVQMKLISIVILNVEDLQITQITAKPGDDVTLSCRAPNETIAVVKWIRSDLNRDVYLNADGIPKLDDQDPSYVNRVQLKDDEMKNGELSLILKNVTNNDEGTYVCRCVEERRGADQSKLISIVYLNVKGHTDGDSRDGKLPGSGKHREDGKRAVCFGYGAVVGGGVVGGVVVGLVVFVIYKCRGRSGMI